MSASCDDPLDHLTINRIKNGWLIATLAGDPTFCADHAAVRAHVSSIFSNGLAEEEAAGLSRVHAVLARAEAAVAKLGTETARQRAMDAFLALRTDFDYGTGPCQTAENRDQIHQLAWFIAYGEWEANSIYQSLTPAERLVIDRKEAAAAFGRLRGEFDVKNGPWQSDINQLRCHWLGWYLVNGEWLDDKDGPAGMPQAGPWGGGSGVTSSSGGLGNALVPAPGEGTGPASPGMSPVPGIQRAALEGEAAHPGPPDQGSDGSMSDDALHALLEATIPRFTVPKSQIQWMKVFAIGVLGGFSVSSLVAGLYFACHH